jgi:hypothetical protein
MLATSIRHRLHRHSILIKHLTFVFLIDRYIIRFIVAIVIVLANFSLLRFLFPRFPLNYSLISFFIHVLSVVLSVATIHFGLFMRPSKGSCDSVLRAVPTTMKAELRFFRMDAVDLVMYTWNMVDTVHFHSSMNII